MKPTKNHYYCPGCQHQKILFASKNEALLFLKYNADTIEEETGKKPERNLLEHITAYNVAGGI